MSETFQTKSERLYKQKYWERERERERERESRKEWVRDVVWVKLRSKLFNCVGGSSKRPILHNLLNFFVMVNKFIYNCGIQLIFNNFILCNALFFPQVALFEENILHME